MTDDQSNIPTEPTPPVDTTEPPPWPNPSEPEPEASPPPAEPRTRSGVVVPLWALLTVGGVLVFALGFLGGWVIAPGDDHDHRLTSSRDLRELAPFFGRNGGEQAPDFGRGDGSEDRTDDGAEPTGYLGVVVQTSSSPRGASVVRVAPSSPASGAGLEAGDVITAIDDTAVRNAAQLTRQVRAHDAGDQVTVEYTRDGESSSVEVELEEQPEPDLPNTEPQSPF